MTTNRLKHIAPKMNKNVNARVLTLDVECSANLVYAFGLRDQHIGLSQIVEHGKMISFAAKWYRDDNVIYKSVHDDGEDDMLQTLWNLLDETDILCTFNGVSFDNKVIRREFLLAGFPPPTPWKDVDLLRIARKQFRFTSNKLQNLCYELGLPLKIEAGGFDLWKRCAEGDAQAWKEMRFYNMNDVVVTEKLMDRMRPWLTGLHHGLWAESGATCTNCGSGKLDKLHGKTVKANVTSYQAYRCTKCGTVVRGNQKQIDTIKTREAR